MKNFTEEQLRVLEAGEIDCIDVVRLMGDYHDQDLPHTLRGRLHAHICECSHCNEMYTGYAFTVALAGQIAQSEPAELPQGVSRRLREALNQRLGLSLAVS